jgi:hypothetical protein
MMAANNDVATRVLRASCRRAMTSDSSFDVGCMQEQPAVHRHTSREGPRKLVGRHQVHARRVDKVGGELITMVH